MNDSVKTAIQFHPFFQGMKPEHLDIVAADAKSAKFETGQMVFREGEAANAFYLIQSGRIALEAHELAGETVKVQDLGPGEVMGWSWLIPPFLWHLQARALESTQVIILNGAHLLVTAEANHDFGYVLMKRVVQIVIHRLDATRRMLLEDKHRLAHSEG